MRLPLERAGERRMEALARGAQVLHLQETRGSSGNPPAGAVRTKGAPKECPSRARPADRDRGTPLRRERAWAWGWEHASP